MDIKTERRHYLNVPMVARYLRLHPLTWRKRIGLRAGVLGCQHEGDCGPGFLRVNTKAGCGELTRSRAAGGVIKYHIYYLTYNLFQFRTRVSRARPG